MPIGSKSYYDNVDSAKKNAGGKLSLFRRGEQPGTDEPALVEAVTQPASQAAAVPAASPIDMVVTQIVELATRTTAILNRAEELAKRAELILASVEEAAERAQAGAMRAELAASRTELNVMTSAIMESSAEVPEPAAILAEEPPLVQDPMVLLAERLRVGIQQMEEAEENIPDIETDENGASATVLARMSALSSTGNSASDTTRAASNRAGRAKSGGEAPPPDLSMQVINDSARSQDNSPSSRTTPSNQADAMAKSLVSVNHDHDIPRVSPYILHFSPKRDEGSSGMKTSKPSPHDNDPRNMAV